MPIKPKFVLVLVVLIIVIGGGVLLFRTGKLDKIFKKHVASSGQSTDIASTSSDYVSFDGSYYFVVPELYTVNDHSLSGTQLVVRVDETYDANSTLSALYDRGVIAVQPVQGGGKLEDIKKFIDTNLKPETEKNLSAKVDVKYDKVNGQDRASLTATKDGKTILVQRVTAADHTAFVVAKEVTPQYDQISTIKDIGALPKPIGDDVTQIRALLESVLGNLKAGKTDEIAQAGSTKFRGQTSAKDLADALKGAQKVIARTINVTGGSYRPDSFTATIYFADPSNKTTPNLIGQLGLVKEDGSWKVDALSLPADSSIK